jgi:hypothetical protein
MGYNARSMKGGKQMWVVAKQDQQLRCARVRPTHQSAANLLIMLL